MYYIVDRYGYIVAESDGVLKHTACGDEMYPHDYYTDIAGAEYYPCNGYDCRDIEYPESWNCETALHQGASFCYCGEHTRYMGAWYHYSELQPAEELI